MAPEELNCWEIGALAQRAADLLNAEWDDPYWKPTDTSLPAMRTTMKLIAKYEQPPVDPLLAEADEFCAKYYEERGSPDLGRSFRDGKFHNWLEYRIALAALRRGIEIERARSAGR